MRVSRHVFRIATSEITDVYPDQLARLSALIARGVIEESAVTAINELQVFARLAATNRLGPGEYAPIAAASERGFVLIIDDRRATRETRSLNPSLCILDTQSVMLELIRDGRDRRSRRRPNQGRVGEASPLSTFLLKFRGPALRQLTRAGRPR